MSEDVADTSRWVLDFREELRLEALRSPDRFLVEWKVGDDYRGLDRLSGGRKVSVLLSLLLEMDDRPPIIDQPEDELDHAYSMSNCPTTSSTAEGQETGDLCHAQRQQRRERRRRPGNLPPTRPEPGLGRVRRGD